MAACDKGCRAEKGCVFLHPFVNLTPHHSPYLQAYRAWMKQRRLTPSPTVKTASAGGFRRGIFMSRALLCSVLLLSISCSSGSSDGGGNGDTAGSGGSANNAGSGNASGGAAG